MIQRMQDCTKHEALNKAKVLIGNEIITKREIEKSLDLNKLYEKFKNNYKKSSKAQEYAKSRGLEIELGYNGSSWPNLKNCLIFPLRNEAEDIVSF